MPLTSRAIAAMSTTPSSRPCSRNNGDTQDLEARKQLIFDIQRYVAAQQYYVYTNSSMITGTWQPYVKNYAPNLSFDYGGRAAALWLDR